MGTEVDGRGASTKDYTKLRRWTSRSGKVLGEGVFVGIEGGAVRIKLKDGTVGRIRVDKLSADDQDFSKKASVALEEAEELVMEEEPRAAPAKPPEADKRPGKAAPDADATASAWSNFFDTAFNTGPRREGELESARMSRELIRLSQIPLTNADPDLAKTITALINLQRDRIGQCKKHEMEIMACDQRWSAKFAEMEKMAAGLAANARSPQEAQQAAMAISLLGGAQMTQERNAEVTEMNRRWAEVYSQYDKKSAAIFQSMEELGPKLERKYQRLFVLP